MGHSLMYTIIIERKAKKFIDSMHPKDRTRIVDVIEKLPNGEDIKPVKGHPGLLRIRVGDYRIVYTINKGELLILVVDAGNRGDIYKRY